MKRINEITVATFSKYLISAVFLCTLQSFTPENTAATGNQSIILIEDGNSPYPIHESLFDIYVDNRYTGNKRDETLVRISETMISSIRVDVSDTTWNDVFSRLSGINIYMDKSSTPSLFDDFMQLKKEHNFNYEEMLRISRGNDKHALYALHSNNRITELILVYQKGRTGGIISLRGNMLNSDLETFRKGINLDNVDGVPGLNDW